MLKFLPVAPKELSRKGPLVSLPVELSRRRQTFRHGHFPFGALEPRPDLQSHAQQPPLTASLDHSFAQGRLLPGSPLLLSSASRLAVPLAAPVRPWAPSLSLPHQTGTRGQANSASPVPFSFIPLMPSTQASLTFPYILTIFFQLFVVIVSLLFNIKLTLIRKEQVG